MQAYWVISLLPLLAACTARPPVQDLSKIVSISIGDVALRLPVVAVSWAGDSLVKTRCASGHEKKRVCTATFETLATSAEGATRAIRALATDVRLEDYDVYKDTKVDRRIGIPELCGMLTQRWAQQICNGRSPWRDVPIRRFSLVEEGQFDALNSSFVDGHQGSIGSIASRLTAEENAPRKNCGPNGDKLCVFVAPVGRRVFAVWIGSSIDTVARQEANAIRAFVDYAAAETEDFGGLEAALQRSRI